MKPINVKIELRSQPSAYGAKIGAGLIATFGSIARKSLGDDCKKIAVVSNPTVHSLYGNAASESLTSKGFTVSQFLVKDGEKYKNLRSAESVLSFLSESGITRTDAVVALGGGVIGDLAGFAAALHLRGIAFVQVPTTLLSMIDSSVGGKTGVNNAFGKNLIGAFHQPTAVVIDPDTLMTLPPRELTAGFCEIIKHGAVGGKKMLKQTSRFLEDFPVDHFRNFGGQVDFETRLTDLIAAQIIFKSKIVSGDPRESSSRRDASSRKILNFGHTLAHALEKVTDYKYFKHGEAVGYGILFAAELSKSLALCDEKDVKLLYDVVQRAGPLPSLTNIDASFVLEALRFDKKQLAGLLQMVLLQGIGKPVIVSEPDHPTIQRTLKEFLRKWQ